MNIIKQLFQGLHGPCHKLLNGTFSFLIWLLIVLACGTTTQLQALQESSDPVAATVGDHKIFLSQVNHQYNQKFADRDVGESLEAGLRYQILQQLCKQQLILERLSTSELYANDDEINLEVSRLKERLATIEKSLETYLVENKQSMAGLRFNYRWQISWKRYVDSVLTDETLEKYFNRHRRQFDGTRVKASHILLPFPKSEYESGDQNARSEKTIDSMVEKAADIRQQLVDEQVTWEEATTRYSQAPSSGEAGDIGWIDYDGPMSRSFTEAAFQLQEGGLSPPVQSPFGVHLIRCVEIKTGVVPWYEIKDQIRRVATQELFRRVSHKQGQETEIRETGVIATTGER